MMSDAQTLRALEADEKYQVVRTLADREAGKTELVRTEGGQLCVRKYIPLEFANPAAWALAMCVESPFISHIVELYALPGQFVAVSEYVEGKPASSFVETNGPLSTVDALGIALQVARGAAALHACGVVHRDIKPSNVVISGGAVASGSGVAPNESTTSNNPAESGGLAGSTTVACSGTVTDSASAAHESHAVHACLVDLGSARVYERGLARDTMLLGTEGFAAPEQYGFAQTDARSDIYSLGRLLAFLTTGEYCSPNAGTRPGDAKTTVDLVEKVAQVCGEDVARIVQKCCEFEPSARYQTDDELIEALDALRSSRMGVGGDFVANAAAGVARVSDAALAPGATTFAGDEITPAGAAANEVASGVATSPGSSRLNPREVWTAFCKSTGARRYAAATVAAGFALFAAFLAVVATMPPTSGDIADTPVMYAVIVLTMAAGLAWQGVHVIAAILKCGKYELPEGRVRRLVGQLVLWFAIICLVVIVEIMLMVTICRF